MSNELWRLDATDQARLIRTGRASAREAVQSSLDRLDAVNPYLNAVIQQMGEEALAAADAADVKQVRGHDLPPLHGVPMTVKVNVDQVGYATTNGIVAFKDAIAGEDAPVVANMRAAGGIIIGRTNLPAFSMRVFSDNALHGRTLNPLDPTVSAGGLEINTITCVPGSASSRRSAASIIAPPTLASRSRPPTPIAWDTPDPARSIRQLTCWRPVPEAPISPMSPRRTAFAKPSGTPSRMAVPQSGPISSRPRETARRLSSISSSMGTLSLNRKTLTPRLRAFSASAVA